MIQHSRIDCPSSWVRKHLWDQHVARLTREERQQLDAGEHPSQSHSRMERAMPIFEEFRSHVTSLPYVIDAKVGAYHLDRIIFTVLVSQQADWRTWQTEIPPFYRGFEVKSAKSAPESL